MREQDAILDRWRAGTDLQEAVLATVVHVTGSAYRQPGARMLIDARGERVGAISGGCLEGELVRKARWWTAGGAAVRAFDTTSDEDGQWEFGLGCNGVVHILLERVGSAGASALLRALDAQRVSGAPLATATVIRAVDNGIAVGARLFMPAAGAVTGDLLGSAIERDLRSHLADVLASGTSRLVRLERADVFVEYVGPPLSLVVFGAGDDAIPVVRFAAEMGWRVTVVDGRPSYARADRFPGADRVVVLSGRDLLGDVAVTDRTAVVVMTHNYPLDERLIPLLVARRPRYLGLLGPRARAERVFDAVGLSMPAWVHAPVGLDIGGDSPVMAALSIVAEIQAAAHGRAGGMLRLRQRSIHEPVVELGKAVGTPVPRSRPGVCDTLVGSHA